MGITWADNPTLSSHPAPRGAVLVFGHFMWELCSVAALPAGILGILGIQQVRSTLCISGTRTETQALQSGSLTSVSHLHHVMALERALHEPGDAKGTGTWNISTQG